MRYIIPCLFLIMLAGCEQKAEPQASSSPAAEVEQSQNSVTASADIAKIATRDPSVKNELKDAGIDVFAERKAEYKSATLPIKNCVDAMIKTTDVPLRKWAASVKAACNKLPETDQDRAADLATALREGEVVFYPAVDALDAIRKGRRLPYNPASTTRDAEWLSLQGNYQAQRNYAFSLRTKNDYMSACAWRLIIINSGHRDVDESDISNAEYECGKLNELQRQAVVAKAETIHSEMQKLK